MKGKSVNESIRKDSQEIGKHSQTPTSMEECLKLIDELKIRQSELEQKLTEKSSETSKLLELNKAIIDHAELMIITTDPEGMITSFNPFAEKMLKYSASEVIGKHTPLLFYDPNEFMRFSTAGPGEKSPGYSLDFREILMRNFKKKTLSKAVERVFVRKDGSRFTGLLSVSSIDDDRNGIAGYVGVVVDITKRKMVEKQYIRTVKENRAIIKAIPDRLFKIRKDGTFYNFKNQIIDSTDVLHDKFSGKNIAEFISGELLQKTNEHIQKALQTREVTKFEYQVRFQEEEHFYESRVVAISDDEVLSIVREISDNKLNEHYSVIHRDLGYTLAATSSIEQALNLVTRAILQIENIHAAGIYLRDKPSEDFKLVVSDGISLAKNEWHRLNDIEYLQHELIRKGGPVYWFSDQSRAASEWIPGKNLNQFELIPIKHENAVIGAVIIGSKSEKKISYTTKIAVEMLTSQVGGTLLRIKSEQALLQSQKNFQLIFDTFDDFMFVFNEEGKIVHVNPAVVKNLGYTKETLQKMTILDVHPPERKDEVTSVLNDVVMARSTVCAIPLMKSDGFLIPVETKVIPGKWNEENVWYCISRDITERHKAEAELKMQSSAFEAFALSIIITDINGQIQWANTSFSELSGYNLSEILGKNPRQIVKSGQQNNDFYKKMWDTILRGEVWRGELINKRKDGSLFPEELTITPVRDHSGKISNFIAIKIDITKRRKMEDALRMSEERWHFALEGSGDGVFDWNLVTGEIFFSDRWKTMLGYEPSEISNNFEEWQKRVHPDDLEASYVDLNNHLTGQTPHYVNEHRMLGKDGNYKWILARGKVIERTIDGKPSRIIGTHKDITDRKLEEEQLRKNIAMEKELSDLKSRFVAMASHEFRTPLASILMITDTLLYHHQKMNSNQLSERLEKIKNHVFHLTNIVSDVLQLSKIQERKVAFNPMKVDIIAICLAIIDEFESQERIKNGRISFHSPFSKLIVSVDKRLIIQVVNNLISNAIKYVMAEPVIDVELKRENAELCLSVRDNGIGVPEEDEKQLFTPFFRARNASSIPGNGLGLSIISESVRMHGGDVSYSRNADSGSTFIVHFPDNLISSYSLK